MLGGLLDAEVSDDAAFPSFRGNVSPIDVLRLVDAKGCSRIAAGSVVGGFIWIGAGRISAASLLGRSERFEISTDGFDKPSVCDFECCFASLELLPLQPNVSSKVAAINATGVKRFMDNPPEKALELEQFGMPEPRSIRTLGALRQEFFRLWISA